MPRSRRVKPVPVLAASPAMIAAMFNIRPDEVADAIARKDLKAYPLGIRKRVLVADAVKWLRTWNKKSKPKTVGVSNVGIDATEHR